MHSIELKFGRYIIGHRPTYSIDFGEFKIKKILKVVQKNSYLVQPMDSSYKKYISLNNIIVNRSSKLKFL